MFLAPQTSLLLFGCPWPTHLPQLVLITQYLTGPRATRASMVFISSDYEYKVALIDKLLKYDFHHYQYLFFPSFGLNAILTISHPISTYIQG